MRSSSADKTPPITRVRRRCRPACPKQAMRMPGPLTLAGDATEPLHAVTKQQLEAAQKSAIPADGSVTEPKIADFAVSIRTLEDEAVTPEKIIQWAVQSDHLADGAVRHEKLGDRAVWTDNLANPSVTKEKLAPDAISDFPERRYGDQKLPSGLILQWGDAIHSRYGGGSVYYPITFPNRVLALAGSHCWKNNSLATCTQDSNYDFYAFWGKGFSGSPSATDLRQAHDALYAAFSGFYDSDIHTVIPQ